MQLHSHKFGRKKQKVKWYKQVRVQNMSLLSSYFSSTYTGLDRHLGVQKVDSRHMKVTRWSTLSTGRLYLPDDDPGNYFCRG